MSGFPSVSSRLVLHSIAWSCISLASVAPFERPRFFASSPNPAPLPQPLQGSPLEIDSLSSVLKRHKHPFSMCFLLTGGPRLALHAASIHPSTVLASQGDHVRLPGSERSTPLNHDLVLWQAVGDPGATANHHCSTSSVYMVSQNQRSCLIPQWTEAASC